MLAIELDIFFDREGAMFVLEGMAPDNYWIRKDDKIVYNNITRAEGFYYMKNLRHVYGESAIL